MDPKTFLNALQLNRAESVIEEAEINARGRNAHGHAARRIEELRAISNVEQALENLISQCGNSPAFAELGAHAAEELRRARRELHVRIHGAVTGDRG